MGRRLEATWIDGIFGKDADDTAKSDTHPFLSARGRRARCRQIYCFAFRTLRYGRQYRAARGQQGVARTFAEGRREWREEGFDGPPGYGESA